MTLSQVRHVGTTYSTAGNRQYSPSEADKEGGFSVMSVLTLLAGRQYINART